VLLDPASLLETLVHITGGTLSIVTKLSDLGVALQATIRSCAVLLPLEFVEGDSCAHLLLLDSASILETLVHITGGTLAR